MVKRTVFITIFVLFFGQNYAMCFQQWSEESARQAAFADVKQNIDVSAYAAKDPNYEENIKALSRNRQRIANRFVTPNPKPPISYLVSEIDANGMQAKTMFYDKDGIPLSMRIFSGNTYPRIAYIYCVNPYAYGKAWKVGQLTSVQFHVSDEESFYFDPQGKCTRHVKF